MRLLRIVAIVRTAKSDADFSFDPMAPVSGNSSASLPPLTDRPTSRRRKLPPTTRKPASKKAPAATQKQAGAGSKTATVLG